MRRSKEDTLKTREAILRTALDCFSTRGYALTTFAHIAERLKLSKGAIFWHFKTKEQLLAEIFAWMGEEYEPLKGVESATSLDDVKSVFMEWAQMVSSSRKQKRFFRFLISRVEWSEALRTRLQKHLEAMMVRDPFLNVEMCIDRLKETGEVVSPLPSSTIAMLLRLTFFGVFREAFLRGVEFDVLETLSTGLDFIIQGIRTK